MALTRESTILMANEFGSGSDRSFGCPRNSVDAGGLHGEGGGTALVGQVM
jgi:hypothetical protein